MRIMETSGEVYVADEDVVRVSSAEVEFLKGKLAATARGRIRLCAHRESGDRLHEMVIVLSRETYIRPHQHSDKSESFHVIEGVADVVVFDDEGGVTDIIPLGDYRSGRPFYYRLSAPRFHTVLIHSDTLVIHETTNGPFRKGDSVLAPWAPDERDGAAGRRFLARVTEACRAFARRTATRAPLT